MSTHIVDLGTTRIKTTIATTEEQVDEAIQAMLSNTKNRKRLIGLDTLTVQVGNEYASPAGKCFTRVIQFYDGSQCFIIHLASLHSNGSLFNFLSFPGFTFAGFGIKDALARLERQRGFVCKNFIEVGPSSWFHYPLIHPSMVCIFLSMHLPTRVSDALSLDVYLTEDLTKVVVSNAYAAFCLGDKILSYFS